MPFQARDMEGLFKKVNRGYYKRINKSYSDDLAQVINSLLKIEPKERKSCSNIFIKYRGVIINEGNVREC